MFWINFSWTKTRAVALSWLSVLKITRGACHKAGVCMCWSPLVEGCGKRINPSSSSYFRWQLNFNPWVWGLFFPPKAFFCSLCIDDLNIFSRRALSSRFVGLGGDAGWMKDFWRQRQMTNNTWPISSREFMEEQHPWAHLRQGKIGQGQQK